MKHRLEWIRCFNSSTTVLKSCSIAVGLAFPQIWRDASDYVAPPGTGVRLAMRAVISETLDQSLAPVEPLADTWVHYGLSLGGYYDLTGQQRSLGLTAIIDFVDPFADGNVPLMDLVSLGGERPLRGFLPNELVDRSAAALRLEYRWPVAVWLDGSLQYRGGQCVWQTPRRV